jgi:hypothetical protein
MASSASSSHPLLLKLPRELRDNIWELTLAPRIIIALPQFPEFNFFDRVAEYDKAGESLYYRELERDSNMRDAYHGSVYRYFHERTDDWNPDEVPKCQNVFYKKYADLALTLTNHQIHDETFKILEKVTKVMREAIQNRQFVEPVRPAFSHLLRQGLVVFEGEAYDILSLLSGAPATLAFVESVYFSQEMEDPWSGGTMRRLWEELYHRSLNGSGSRLGIAKLLKTHLPNLKELAFWAPIEDYAGNWEYPFPIDMLVDIYNLVDEGPLDALHIVLASGDEDQEILSNGVKRLFEIGNGLERFMNRLAFFVTRDDKDLQLAERRWNTSGIQAIGTLRRVEG